MYTLMPYVYPQTHALCIPSQPLFKVSKLFLYYSFYMAFMLSCVLLDPSYMCIPSVQAYNRLIRPRSQIIWFQFHPPCACPPNPCSNYHKNLFYISFNPFKRVLSDPYMSSQTLLIPRSPYYTLVDAPSLPLNMSAVSSNMLTVPFLWLQRSFICPHSLFPCYPLSLYKSS